MSDRINTATHRITKPRALAMRTILGAFAFLVCWEALADVVIAWVANCLCCQDARSADHCFLERNMICGCPRSAAWGKTPQLGPVSFLRLPSPLLSPLLLLLPLRAPVLIKEMDQK